jgi:hypothetical protein
MKMPGSRSPELVRDCPQQAEDSGSHFFSQEVDMATEKSAAGKPRTGRASERGEHERITIENVNVPGYATRVDARMYHAMRQAMLRVLPSMAPGLTHAEIRGAVVSHLPSELFPGGAKAVWWAKTVQLDLEAKGVLVREATKPLRWHQRSESQPAPPTTRLI